MVKRAPDLGRGLRERRLNLGLSQAQVAELAHTSQPQIDRLEKGMRKLTKEWAERLARILHCHWTELMGEEAPFSQRERTLIDLYRALADEDKEAAFRVFDALAKRAPRQAGNG